MLSNSHTVDFEFNSLNGVPISLGMVHASGDSFYAIFEENSLANLRMRGVEVDPWIVENVYAKLNDEPKLTEGENRIMAVGTTDYIQRMLELYLKRCSAKEGILPCDSIMITADWPDDIKYFTQLMITGPGTMIDVPYIQFEVVRLDAYPCSNKDYVQHNALADAMALRLKMKELHQNLIETCKQAHTQS